MSDAYSKHSTDPTCPHCKTRYPDWADVVSRDYYAPSHATDGEEHVMACKCGKAFKFTAIVLEVFFCEPMADSPNRCLLCGEGTYPPQGGECSNPMCQGFSDPPDSD